MGIGKQDVLRGCRRGSKPSDFEDWSFLVRSELPGNTGGGAE